MKNAILLLLLLFICNPLLLCTGAKIFYGDYYGDSGMDKTYPEYNVQNALNSSAGSAIASITNDKINVAGTAELLRKYARVVCSNFTSYPKCSDSCLFDVYDDPCETTDLSSKYPQVGRNNNYYRRMKREN